MTIPSSQLETWSHLPSAAQSAAAYESARTALANAKLASKFDYEVYLQGSYANSTNIRSDSDIDVVIELESIFRHSLDHLSSVEKSRFLSETSPATKSLADFERDVFDAVVAYFGSQYVSRGEKCIKVAARSGRPPIDILVCQTYRDYFSYPSSIGATFIKGIYFRTRSGRGIVNYPKLHKRNGSDKQSRCSTFKKTVRATKNARRKLRDDGVISNDVAPSYFVECLLYNVPDGQFAPDLAASYVNSLVWLGQHRDGWGTFLCQNGVTRLFGSTPEQWDQNKADILIGELSRQYVDWA